MLSHWFSRLLGTSPALRVARELGKVMDARPAGDSGPLRFSGAWKGMRCQVTLDGKSDEMTVTAHAPPHNLTWAIVWADADSADRALVSTNAALSAADTQRLERLPMKVRLHVIEVVEAGRGSIRLEGGNYTLKVTRAGMSRPNAAAQAAIRMDVLKDLVAAAGKVF